MAQEPCACECRPRVRELPPDMDISLPKKGVPPSSKTGDPVNKTERCGIL